MNRISLASTPKSCIQHQNQSLSTQRPRIHSLRTQGKTSTTLSQSGRVNNTLNKRSCKDEAGFSGSSQWLCRQSWRKSTFLAVHGGQWLSLCWLVIVLSSCTSNTIPSTPEALSLRPAWDFPASFPGEWGNTHKLLSPDTSPSSPVM